MPDRPDDATASDFPEPFAEAVRSIPQAQLRPEVGYERMPAPTRIAPYAIALSGEVEVGDVELATGRLIVLHDPAGNDTWEGNVRCVAYVRAEIEDDLAHDPAFAGAAWSWLLEALQDHGSEFSAISGTVTTVGTESFGNMLEDAPASQVEIRASWTPRDIERRPAALAQHVTAWSELMCMAAGREPIPEGVTSLPSRRGQRGT
jgi:hypothetical protein